MDPKADEYLSAEELRDRLYQSLRGRGTVNSIKTQLRNSLLTELQQCGHKPVPGQSVRHGRQESRFHRAVNSLIVDYLRRMKFDYSLSVFLPESGTTTDKVLNYKDVLQLLQVNPQSKLFRKVASNVQDQATDGFLWQFLCELSALNSTPSIDDSTQTDGVHLVAFSSLDDKLMGVDEYYSFRRDENFRASATGIEERLLSYQRQVEAESRHQLKLELARFRENDLSRMRLEEKENCRQEIERARIEMEKTYRARADALAERETNALKRIEKDQEIQSREVYAQRQTVLQEIEAVRKREAQVKRDAEALQREKQLLEERIQSREENVRRKESELNKAQREYDQRLESDMTQFKMEEQTKFLKRTQNLDYRETRVREEEKQIKEEKEQIQSLKDDLREKTSSVNRLEMLLQETKSKEVAASCSNETLNARIREMSDYSVLREDNFRMKAEIETLKMRLNEMTQLYTKSQMMLGEPQTERDPPGAHDRSQRGILRDPRPEYSPRRSQSDITVSREVERNRELLRQFEQSTLQQKEMYREMMDLRQQLHLTQQALNNEIYRKPRRRKPDGVDDSGPSQLSDDWSELKEREESRLRRSDMVPRYEDNEVYNDVDIDGEMMAPPRRLNYEELSDDDGCQSDPVSGDIVAEAKYRLKSLEREAENLEQTYRDFQYRLTNVHAVPPGAGRSPAKKSLPTFTEELTKQAGIQRPRYGQVTASPIPTVRDDPSLVSSTPCPQTRQRHHSNDSLSELTTPSNKPGRESGRQEDGAGHPSFHISELSGEDASRADAQRDRSNLITLADLEARPGSPSVVVVPGSESSGSKQDHPLVEKTSDRAMGREYKDVVDINPVISLDQAWQMGSKMNTDEDKQTKGGEDRKISEEKERRRKEEEEEERRWQEERRRKEEARKQREQEEWEREQRELERVQGAKGGGSESDEKDKPPVTDQPPRDETDPDGDNIDPVMKQYMAMVQQQKQAELQKEKEAQSGLSKDKTPPPSENDISFAEDVGLKSDNDSIPDFDW